MYNESAVLPDLIAHLDSLKYNGIFEIIIVDGHPNKTTLKTVPANPRLTLLSSAKGRACQMNTGAEEASGDILLFLHADNRLPQEGLNDIAKVLYSRKIVAGAFKLGIDSQHPGLKIIEIVANIRTQLTRIPYGDQSIFIKKDYFHKIGGYSDIPLMEDVELMKKIKKQGQQILLINKRTWTSPRRWLQQGITYCTLRNWFLITLYLLGVSPQKLVKYYY